MINKLLQCVFSRPFWVLLAANPTFRLHEPMSKLLVCPLITPTVVPYVIPYKTPFKEFRLWLTWTMTLENCNVRFTSCLNRIRNTKLETSLTRTCDSPMLHPKFSPFSIAAKALTVGLFRWPQNLRHRFGVSTLIPEHYTLEIWEGKATVLRAIGRHLTSLSYSEMSTK